MKIRRPLAFLLAFAMLISLMVAPVSAVEITEDSFELKADAVVTVDGTVDQTVNVVLSAKEAMSIIACEGTFSTKETEDSSYICLTDYISPVDLKGMNYFYVNNGAVVYRDGDLEGYEVAKNGNVMTAVYTVDKDTPAGKYTVKFSAVNLQEYDFNNVEMVTYSAIIEVKAPAVPAADYEIYYELDSNEDVLDATGATGADGFMEYDVNSDVTATVYMKNNTEASVTMQAYDIYLDYSEKLIYESHALEGAVAYAEGKETAFDEEEDTVVDHIQLIKGTKTITLASGEAVELGDIVFSFADGAAFDEELEIILVDAADANNSAKAEDVTNFSVGDTNEGDATSYYPADVSAVLGAEIDTTYTVTYDANGGTFAEGAATTQIKQHNVDLTIEAPATPSRDKYSFMGWSTDSGENNEVNAPVTYTTNEDEVLYAVWQKNTHTITFVDDDGTELDSIEVEDGNVPAYPGETPTKEATAQYTYKFAGWTPTLAPATEDATYTATYTSTVNKYTVTWKNGETPLETDENVTYGTAPSYNEDAPTKEQTADKTFTFTGWSTDPNAETGIKVENLPTVSGPTTYYAIFTEADRMYTVTFDANGHGTAPEAKKIAYNNKVEKPDDLSAEHYVFGGWYTDPGCAAEKAYNFDDAVVTDVTLYAKWTPVEYTITFVPGDGAEMDNDAPTTMTYTVEGDITLPTASKNGMNFGGWQLAEDDEGWTAGIYNGTISAGKYGNIELNAVWTDKPLTVVKDIVNGDVVIANNDGVSGNKANEDDVINITLAPAIGYETTADTKVTYTYTPEGATEAITEEATKNADGTYSFTMPNAEDVTVKVTYTAISYKIDYELNDGEVSGNPDTYTIESDDITLVAPTKDGYTFAGWTGSNGTTAQTDVTIAKGSTGDKTYTANWTVNEYKITYMDGEKSIGEGKYTVENEVILKTDATKTGYTFEGWYENADLTGNRVEKIEAGTTDDKIYYAKWTPNTDTKYTVQHWQQNIGADADNYETGYTLKETDNLTGTTATNVTPAVKDYTGFTAPKTQTVTIAADGTTVVKYYYTRNTYTIELNEDGGSYAEGVTEPTEYVYGVGATLPTPTRGGYSFEGWYDADGNKVESISATDIGDKELTAHWTPVQYTITFDANNGVLIGEAAPNYDITDNITLPTVTRTNYTFAGWKVTKAEGNWTVGDEYSKEATEIPAGKYGNVTLTAQWTRAAAVVVEDYKYAATDYYMIRVADTLESTQEYKFGGVSMYWIEDANYAVEGNNKVFYTLVSDDYVEKNNQTGELKLTDAGYALLATDACAERTEIDYNGDINDDGVLNIADANIIYQMVINGGGYYGDTLDIEARLKADMAKSTDDTDNVHRGSIADVNDVVNDINGTN